MTEDSSVVRDMMARRTAIAEIRQGLNSSDDWFWRDKANRRIAALEEDGAVFGLLAHEQAELDVLRTLIA